MLNSSTENIDTDIMRVDVNTIQQNQATIFNANFCIV